MGTYYAPLFLTQEHSALSSGDCLVNEEVCLYTSTLCGFLKGVSCLVLANAANVGNTVGWEKPLFIVVIVCVVSIGYVI